MDVAVRDMPDLGDSPAWMRHLFGPEARRRPIESIEQVVENRFLELPLVNADPPEIAEVHEQVVLRERHGTALTAELYVPKGKPPFPAFLYMHGGGWCHGSAASVRRLARRIAEQGVFVCNLDYGLAPEHAFPWAVEDAVYACRWLVRNAERYGGDAAHVAIGGDSAGANLAAAAIVHLSGGGERELDEGELAGVDVDFAAALFLYGVFDFPLLMSDPAPPFGAVETMFNRAYLGENFLARHRDPLVSPIYAANIAGFPPVYLASGDGDYLIGQSLAMTKALAAASVPTTLSVVEGAQHAFAQLEHALPTVTPELERIFAWLEARTHT